MKSLVLLSFLMLMLSFGYGQASTKTILNGVIKSYPEGKPLSGVNVIARGNGSKMTEIDGGFSFVFSDKQPGDKVYLTPLKGDYKPARFQSPIPVYLRTNPDDLFMIELCKTGACLEDEIYKEVYDKFIKQINGISDEIKELPQGSKRVQILEDSIQFLTQELVNKEALLRDISKQIAFTDYEAALPSTQKALEYLELAKIDSAIWVLENAGIKKQLRAILAEEEEVKKAQQKLAEKEQRLKKEKDEHIQAHLTLARSYALNNQKDSSIAMYEVAVKADTSQYENLFDFANYLEDINEYDHAMKLYSELLEKPLESWRIGLVHAQMGEILKETGKLPKASKSYLNYHKVFLTLYQEDTTIAFYKNGLAISYEKLGGIYESQGQLDSALMYYQIETDLFKELYAANPQSINLLFGLGVSYYKLGSVNQKLRNRDECLSHYYKSLEIFRVLYERTSLERYGRGYMSIRSTVLQIEEEMFSPKEKAEKAKERIRLYEESIKDEAIEEDERQDVMLSMANAYGSLAWHLLFDKKFVEAEKTARKGLDLGKVNPAQTKWIYTNLATALLFQSKYEEAEAIYSTYKDEQYDEDRTWKEVFLEDLDKLEEADIIHADITKIRILLEK